MKPVPGLVTVITGDEHLVYPTIDDFFLDTAEFIKGNYGLKPGPNPFRIESGEIAYGLASSDDRITYLSFFGRAVATVMAIRTDFNNVQYVFFRNLEGIEDLVERHNNIYEVR